MPYTLQNIYSGTLPANSTTLSTQFNKADFLFFASTDTGEYFNTDRWLEINVALVVEIQPGTKRIVPIAEAINTREVLAIPYEYRNDNFQMQVCFNTSDGADLTALAISADIPCGCKAQLDTIQQQLLLTQAGLIANAIAQDAALGALASTLGASLIPITAGLSSAIPAAVLPILAPVGISLPLIPSLVGLPALP